MGFSRELRFTGYDKRDRRTRSTNAFGRDRRLRSMFHVLWHQPATIQSHRQNNNIERYETKRKWHILAEYCAIIASCHGNRSRISTVLEVQLHKSHSSRVCVQRGPLISRSAAATRQRVHRSVARPLLLSDTNCNDARNSTLSHDRDLFVCRNALTRPDHPTATSTSRSSTNRPILINIHFPETTIKRSRFRIACNVCQKIRILVLYEYFLSPCSHPLIAMPEIYK